MNFNWQNVDDTVHFHNFPFDKMCSHAAAAAVVDLVMSYLFRKNVSTFEYELCFPLAPYRWFSVSALL